MAGNQTKSESTLIKKVGDIANVMAALQKKPQKALLIPLKSI